MASTRGRLRNDFPAASSSVARSTSVGSGAPQSVSSEAARLVEGSSHDPASKTATDSRSAWTERAPRSAPRRALRLTFTVYRRGLGPKVVAPPTQSGDRDEPARARPVPFWRHGLAPPPEISLRLRVEAVPLLRA